MGARLFLGRRGNLVGLSFDDELLGASGSTGYAVAWEEKSSILHKKKVQSSETNEEFPKKRRQMVSILPLCHVYNSPANFLGSFP